MSQNKQSDDGVKLVVKNRKARYEFEVDEVVEAGLVLRGSEVKAIRNGTVQIADAYAQIERGEVFLHQMHVGEYKQATISPHAPRRVRKLLLNKREIERLQRKVHEKGFTLIPLELYFKRGRAKVALGLCRGKKAYDKRKTIRDRDVRRDMEREQG